MLCRSPYLGWIGYAFIFANKQHSYDPWLLSKFRFRWISCGRIWSNFAFAVNLIRSWLGLLHASFHKFTIELWHLIIVEISFPLNILNTNELTEFDQILHVPVLGWNCYASIFANLLQSYGSWLSSAFLFRSISWERIEGLDQILQCIDVEQI